MCCSSAAVHQICKTEHEERQVKCEEEQEEGHGRAEGADEQQEGEDEPGHEVESEGVEERIGRFCLERFHDFETTGGQNDGSADPETAVRGERGGTKGVAESNFPGTCQIFCYPLNSRARNDLPHASEKLDETAISESSADNDVGVLKTAGAQVDAGQDEGSQGESTETERSWVGELAGGGLVETGLEVTTEGGKTG